MRIVDEAGPFCVGRLPNLFLEYFYISFAANYLTVGIARHGALWTGRMSLNLSLVWCLSILTRQRCPSHMSSNSESKCGNSSPRALYLLWMLISSGLFSVSLVFFFCATCSWFSICEILPMWSWWESDWHYYIAADCNYTKKVHHIYGVWWLREECSLWRFADDMKEKAGHCLD